MKLTELDPHWVAISQWTDANGTMHFLSGGAERRIGGVSFNCPVHFKPCPTCGHPMDGSHRLVVWFANPLDGREPQDGVLYRWQRTGDTFETMTLMPSVDATGFNPGCWHGFITNGEVQ